jgi:AraC family transcriptional regulator
MSILIALLGCPFGKVFYVGPLAPQLPGTITATSAGTRWTGFPLEVHKLPAQGESPAYAYPYCTAFLYTSGEATAVIASPGEQPKRVRRCQGVVNLRARGWAVHAFAWHARGDLELLTVQLSAHVIEALGVGTTGEALHDMFLDGMRDHQLAALMRSMQLEVEGGCLSGPLYAESLSLCLATYASRRYASASNVPCLTINRLSPAQLRRVRAYIADNLGQPLPLTDIAHVVDLSPHHFCLLFKNTMGMSPHQYVIAERIRKASSLLRDKRRSITDIALSVGFSSHSHFSETFRRHTGKNPRYLRC